MAHGVRVSEIATSLSTPVVADVGIPFFVGTAPVHSADSPATTGVPCIATSWSEAVDKLGYNEDWEDFTLCEAMYSHFQLYSMQPAIFLNVLDVSTMNESKAAADFTVTDHKVNLGNLAINNASLVVKNLAADANPLVKDTDYAVYYSDGDLIVELLSTGSAYASASLNIAYKAVKPSLVTTSAVALAFDKVELCMSSFGVVPDLLVAPGFSSDSGVAAAMASKAVAINSLFRAKALVDLPTDNGTNTYTAAITAKTTLNMTDLNQIVCWPKVALSNKVFHLSTQMAGLMASIDSETGTPYASPSNHTLRADRLVDDTGSEILLTYQQANMLENVGICTGLNFMGSFNAWGNWTACYPTNTDVKDYIIPVSRMVDFIGNTLIRTFWGQLDKPMTRRFVGSIMDSVNIWLGGLVGSGYLLGGRCEMIEDENPITDLMSGIIKLHVYITPPSPAHEIDFYLEYDPSYVQSALQL